MVGSLGFLLPSTWRCVLSEGFRLPSVRARLGSSFLNSFGVGWLPFVSGGGDYGVHRLQFLHEPSCGIHQLPCKCVGPTISHGSHLLSCQARLRRIQSKEGNNHLVLHLCNNTSVVIGSQGTRIQRRIDI